MNRRIREERGSVTIESTTSLCTREKAIRRITSLILAVFMIATIMVGCSSSEVTITVGGKYENGLANELSTNKTYDDDGNITYTFTKPQYLEYLGKLMEKVKSEYREVLGDTATYSYLNEDGTELVVGIDKSVYDETECKEQAQQIGQLALLYNTSVLDHTGKVTVTYENCNTGEVYFKTEV